MEKYKFVGEYEFRASAKVLFPYISTASGLQEWFAAKVLVKGDHLFDFVWDNDNHPARMTTHRLNKLVRFDFLNNEQKGNYVEFKVEVSDLTNATFFKVTDCSDNADAEDLKEMWEGMTDKLKEIVGG